MFPGRPVVRSGSWLLACPVLPAWNSGQQESWGRFPESQGRGGWGRAMRWTNRSKVRQDTVGLQTEPGQLDGCTMRWVEAPHRLPSKGEG